MGRVFVSARTGGEITIVSTWLAFCAGVPASVTFTVTVALPAVVGMPLTTHALRERPAGRVPVMEHV